MSYILDALQRAEAQREQGSVPGLHARQMAGLSAPAARGGRWPVGLVAAGALALGALAAGLWVWLASTPPAVNPGATALRVAPTEPSVPSSAALAPAAPPLVVLPPAVVEQPKPAAPVPALTVTARPAQLRALAARPSQPVAVKVTEPVVPGRPVAAGPSKAPEVAVSIPLLGDLPEELRRQIPPLNITGAVYSEHPGQRMLLVNGLVLKQGDLVAPELSVEEIRARSSVFGFRGTRFRLAH